MANTPSVSSTNTKAEILQACQAVLAELRQQREDNTALRRELGSNTNSNCKPKAWKPN